MNLSEIVFLAQAAAPAGQQAAPNPLMQIPFFIFIIVIFYFLLIRPQQKKQKEHAALVASVKTGDKVITSAGIHGIIANVKDKTVIVKVADNVKLEFDRAAITTIAKASDSTPETK